MTTRRTYLRPVFSQRMTSHHHLTPTAILFKSNLSSPVVYCCKNTFIDAISDWTEVFVSAGSPLPSSVSSLLAFILRILFVRDCRLRVLWGIDNDLLSRDGNGRVGKGFIVVCSLC